MIFFESGKFSTFENNPAAKPVFLIKDLLFICLIVQDLIFQIGCEDKKVTGVGGKSGIGYNLIYDNTKKPDGSLNHQALGIKRSDVYFVSITLRFFQIEYGASTLTVLSI